MAVDAIELTQRAPSASIVQADCMEFLRSLPDASVDLITTDPAYSGMNQHLKLGSGRIVGEYQDAGAEGAKWFAEFQDHPETFLEFLRECHRVLQDDRHIYVMFDSFSLLSLGALMREVFAVKNLIVWDKQSIGMGHNYRRRHELILFASKGKLDLRRKDLPDVWDVKRLHRSAYPTQKPVEVFERMLQGSGYSNFTVCDPFVGSGSSAIAALKFGYSFIGCDVSDKAVAMSQERVYEFLRTGIDTLEHYQ